MATYVTDDPFGERGKTLPKTFWPPRPFPRHLPHFLLEKTVLETATTAALSMNEASLSRLGVSRPEPGFGTV